MSGRDWAVAGVLAVATALVVVAAGLPPILWAEDPVRVVIPELPGADLKIPSLEATIKAEATREPGEAVTVTLSGECPAEHAGATVPLVVHVHRIDPANMLSRMPRPASPKEVTSATCSLFIDSDGKGTVTVELPLTWASDEGNAREKLTRGGYFLVLTSPLVPAKGTRLNGVVVPVSSRQVAR